MPEFQVHAVEVHVVPITVQAENETEARDKAYELYRSGHLHELQQVEAEYSHTKNPEEWDVLPVFRRAASCA